MSNLFPRPALAHQMAQQLLNPGVLDEGLRSGLFLSGLRRTGKTTFLLNDLIPALEDGGAIVIYADLWTDTQTNPSKIVRNAIQKKLKDLESPATSWLSKLKQVSAVDVDAMGFKLGLKIEAIGDDGGPTIADVLVHVVDKLKADVVLIIDEVQHAITSEEGNQFLFSLKAARDAVNQRPNTPGHFLFIGTGSHRALVSEMAARRNQAFTGATSIPYPLLDGQYVSYLLNRMTLGGINGLPTLEGAIKAFLTLGNRPEELIKALRQLTISLPLNGDPDAILMVIAETLRSTAADIELLKVEQIGGLATAIFERIAATEGDARGVFSVEAADEYSRAIGREVKVDDIQPVVNELLAANIIMRRGHGLYGITDPFVQEIWRERRIATQR